MRSDGATGDVVVNLLAWGVLVPLLGCFQDTAEVYEATWLQGEVSGTFGEVDSLEGK